MSAPEPRFTRLPRGLAERRRSVTPKSNHDPCEDHAQAPPKDVVARDCIIEAD